MSELRTETYRITGMDCADCAKTIEHGVSKLDGVTSCSLNFGAAVLKVEGASRDVVIQRVKALGYGVANDPHQTQKADTSTPATANWISRLPSNGLLGFLKFLLQKTDTTMAVLGALLILPSLIFVEIGPLFTGVKPESLVFDTLSLAAMLVAGFPIARSAWRAITINREININVLMTMAAIGAVIIGAYTEAGLVMVLFAIGEALEGYTAERARDSIRSLMEVVPNEATLLELPTEAHVSPTTATSTDGFISLDAIAMPGEHGHETAPHYHERRVDVTMLKVGNLIMVKPGERIAMDGRIRKGASSVNQAPITGESVPVEKQPGNEVFAGTINGEGTLEIEVTNLAADNTISRIIRMVEEAQERKAPAERFVDQFAKYYTPMVVAIAALVAVVPPLLFGAPFLPLGEGGGDQGWLYRALELLVVACPCALVISTPVVIISAISNAARNGVLIKGGAYLEALSKVKAIAFDKTGTLTEGQPRVVQVKSIHCSNPQTGSCANCDDLLALASAVEKRSEHPLAKAVVVAADENNLSTKYPAAESVKAITGKGVIGNVNGHDVVIGSHVYFDQTLPHDRAQCDEIETASAAGRTTMLVGTDNGYVGYITVADAVRDSSRQAIAELKQAGVTSLVMLTGDNAATAQKIADEVGVNEVKAELLPENKVDAIKELLYKHGSVAMVGDGVNDAPALATATVGIAMGAGTAQAMETADVVLLGNDLSKLPFALKLSRAALNTIRANIAFAIGIKLAFLVLVLLGFGTMWMAVLADVGASLLVTLNGMRLLKFKG
jgi:Cd2+/Zn2+-exporting ATPase